MNGIDPSRAFFFFKDGPIPLFIHLTNTTINDTIIKPLTGLLKKKYFDNNHDRYYTLVIILYIYLYLCKIYNCNIKLIL